MSKKGNKVSVGFNFPGVGIIGAVCTAIIGQTIHGSIFWGMVDFFFWPLVWIKWLICRDVNMSIIRDAFSWFLT